MKLFKKLRKGFTLIELVVVIAVIAILAAVSVVSYVSITNRAKQSNDQQKVDQTNYSLQALEVRSGKPKTMYEAVKSVEEDGFKPENFKAEAKDYTFAYAMEENRFVILKDQQVVYPTDMKSAAGGANIWLFEDAVGDFGDSYSHYFRGEGLSGSISAKGGVDVGDNAGITSVSYSSTASQDVVIRTIGGTLNVGTSSQIAKGTIRHYNYVDKAVVYTEKSSFHAHGAVGRMELKEGRAVAEKGGVIYLAEAPATTEVKQEGGVVLIPAGVSTTEVAPEVAQTIGYSDPGSATTYDNVQPTDKTYNIGSLEELKNFRDIVNGGFNFKGLTAKLTSNITLEKGWKPIGEGSRDVSLGNYSGSYLKEHDGVGASFAGTFDGNNKTIYNLDSTGYTPTLFSVDGDHLIFTYGFFGILNNATVKNLTFKDVNIEFTNYINVPYATTEQKIAKADSVAALAGFSAEGCTISGVTVNGSIKAYDAVGGIVGRAYSIAITEDGVTTKKDGSVSISNCVNNATISAIEDKAAGILGYAKKGKGNSLSVSLSKNVNNGKVSSKCFAAGITIVQELNAKPTLDKNENKADISVAEYVKNSTTGVETAVGVGHVCIGIGFDNFAGAATNNSSTAKTYLAGSEIVGNLVGKNYPKNDSNPTLWERNTANQ